MSNIRMNVSSAPTKPASGQVYIYVDNDKHIKTIDEAGAINDLTTGGTGGVAEAKLIVEHDQTKAYAQDALVWKAGKIYKANKAITAGTAWDAANFDAISTDIAGWDAANAYNKDDVVIKDNQIYKAKENIPAGAWDATKWNVAYADYSQPIRTWAANTSYAQSDIIIYNSKLYQCTTANNDAAFDAGKWNEVSPGTTITVDSALSDTSENPVQNKAIKAGLEGKANATQPVRAWANNSIYSIGDLVIKDKKFYQCKVAIIAGMLPKVFTASDWDEVSADSTNPNIVIENFLNGTSENAVQNKILFAKFATKEDKNLKGADDGYCELDATGKVPPSRIPGTVSNVAEHTNLAGFPATGVTNTIYVAKDTNKTYRWSGTQYTEISASLALGETAATAYRGDKGKVAYDHSQLTTGNPHSIDKADIGLGNVDNTSDLAKPISTATQAELDKKALKAQPIEKFSTSVVYALNNMVIYDNKIYECNKTNTGAGVWVSADWTEISATGNIIVDGAVSDSSLNPVQNKIIKKYVDDTIVGGVTLKGSYDANANTPNLNSNPTGVKKGDMYVVTADGTFLGEAVHAGDSLIANQDDPTTLAHWITVQDNSTIDVALNGTSENAVQNKVINTALDLKEDKANKVTAFQATPDNIKYPSEKLVNDSLNLKADKVNPLNPWAINIAYEIGHQVVDLVSKKIYRCNAAHNSGGGTITDNIAKWDELSPTGGITIDSAISGSSVNAVQNKIVKEELDKKADIKQPVSTWAFSTGYVVGDQVLLLNDKKLYRCKTAHTSSASSFASDLANWDEVSASESGIDHWEISKSYSIGDLIYTKPADAKVGVNYQSKIYRCKTAYAHDTTNFENSIGNWDEISASIVDSALSASSENAVQNKVIKAELDKKANELIPIQLWATEETYVVNQQVIDPVDNKLYRCNTGYSAGSSPEKLSDNQAKWTEISAQGGISIDAALSDTSENPVQNKKIKEALDLKEDAANRRTSFQATPEDTKYVSEKLVKDSLDTKLDVNKLIDEDTMISDDDTKVPTQQSVKKYVDDLVSGGVRFKGAYNASTNSPNLDASPSITIKKGDMYVVSVDGDFFTETMQAGDSIIARKASPTVLADWIRVEKNSIIDSALSASSENAVQNKVIKAELDLKEVVANKVTAFQATPEDTKYPSEKLVKDNLNLKEDKANLRTSFQATPEDTKYVSEKLVKDQLDLKITNRENDIFTYANIAARDAATGLKKSDMCNVTDINKSYVYDGSAWVLLAQAPASSGEANIVETVSNLTPDGSGIGNVYKEVAAKEIKLRSLKAGTGITLTQNANDVEVVGTDIIDNLTSTDTDKALSANQGKILEGNKLAKADVISNLTTDDATKALSAAMGKSLDDTKFNKVDIRTSAEGFQATPADNEVPSEKLVKTELDNKLDANKVIDEDTMTSNADDKVPTQQSVKAYVDSLATGGVTFKGGYNISTNSPILTNSKKGDMYVISVGGTFLGEIMEAGDSIIAQQDDPTALVHWIRVDKNSTIDSNWIVDSENAIQSKVIKTELDTKVDKVAGKGLTKNELTDALKTDYDDAVTKKHEHANKTKLDDLAPIAGDAGKMVVVKSAGAGFEFQSIAAGHTHTNKSELDKIPTSTSAANLGKVLKVKAGDELEWGTASDGDVTGPASAVDKNLAIFDGTTGKLIKDSGILTGTNFIQPAGLKVGDFGYGATYPGIKNNSVADAGFALLQDATGVTVINAADTKNIEFRNNNVPIAALNTTSLNMYNKKITGLTDGTASGDAIHWGQRGAADGVASLVAGKVPMSQLNALAITDVSVAANETAHLALANQGEGDVVIRTDLNKSYIHNGGSANSMADWQEVLSPTADIEDQIVDGVTNKAASQNAIFDALVLKVDKSVIRTNSQGILPTPLDTNIISEKLADTLFGQKVNKAGDTMSGDLNMGVRNITNVKELSFDAEETVKIDFQGDDKQTIAIVDDAQNTMKIKADQSFQIFVGNNELFWANFSTLNSKVDFDMGGQKITGLGTPINASDAVSKGYLDSSYLVLDGTVWMQANKALTWNDGTVSGDRLNLGNNITISEFMDATKSYLQFNNTNSKVDRGFQFKTGATVKFGIYDTGLWADTDLNMGGKSIKALLDPIAAQDAATKNYVDTQVATKGTGDFKADGSVAMTGAFKFSSAAGVFKSQDDGNALWYDNTIVSIQKITNLNNKIYNLGNPQWGHEAVILQTMDAKEDIKTQATGGAASIQMKFWKGTQGQYDAIGTKDANTFYAIV